MKSRTIIGLLFSHLMVLLIGFAAGVYLLPILTAPPPPELAVLEQAQGSSTFQGEFSKDREDSDALHWGEGVLSVGSEAISLMGKLAPGPDYRLYLSPQFVETEADFKRLKSEMVEVGSVKTFENFVLAVPDGINPAQYRAAIVWCEAFGQFITSAEYSPKPL